MLQSGSFCPGRFAVAGSTIKENGNGRRANVFSLLLSYILSTLVSSECPHSFEFGFFRAASSGPFCLSERHVLGGGLRPYHCSLESGGTPQGQHPGNCPKGRIFVVPRGSASILIPANHRVSIWVLRRVRSIRYHRPRFCEFSACTSTSLRRRTAVWFESCVLEVGCPPNSRMHGGPAWKLWEFIDKLGTAASETLRRVGRFLYPLHFSSAAPSEIFGLWGILCNGRIGTRNCELTPSRDPPVVFGDCLDLFWEFVVRNIDRARRRMLRPGCVPGHITMDPITADDGTILHAPSAGGDLLVLPSGPLALHLPFGFFESSSDSEDGLSCFHSHSGVRFGNWTQRGFPCLRSLGATESRRQSEHVTSPKRASGNACEDAPPPPRLRTDSQRAREEACDEFRERPRLPLEATSCPPTLMTRRDTQLAICFPPWVLASLQSHVPDTGPRALSRAPHFLHRLLPRSVQPNSFSWSCQ